MGAAANTTNCAAVRRSFVNLTLPATLTRAQVWRREIGVPPTASALLLNRSIPFRVSSQPPISVSLSPIPSVPAVLHL